MWTTGHLAASIAAILLLLGIGVPSGAQAQPADPDIDVPVPMGDDEPDDDDFIDDFFDSDPDDEPQRDLDVKAGGFIRAYYRNDQRIFFSGVETTFGAEAGLHARATWRRDGWDLSAATRFAINQPYNLNLFRVGLSGPNGYQKNFVVNELEIKEMYLEVGYGDLLFVAGKKATFIGARPMQRAYANDGVDRPFLHTEIIDPTEVGVWAHLTPGCFEFIAGVSNGVEDIDTNSSKAVIARIGVNLPHMRFGVSARLFNRVGSEFQKYYSNYVVGDFMLMRDGWYAGIEVGWDEHGLRRKLTDLSLLDRRSYYGLDVYNGETNPVWGFGIGVAAGYVGQVVRAEISLSSYRPEPIGIPTHDAAVFRFLAKLAITPFHSPDVELFAVYIDEPRRPVDPLIQTTRNWFIYTGMQYRW
ncbi:MAG: hypothetical protein AB7K09_11910 [Planctomycetota bacterium]